MKTPVTIDTLARMKQQGEKIVSLTAYDAAFAGVLDAAGVDVILVGDSLGMVLHGRDDTLGVTMENMVYHSRLVRDGTEQALIVTDMPYRSYTSRELALDNARELMNAGGANVVKLEGGGSVVDIVAHLVAHEVPVCGHLGLTPQSVHELGGYRVQGRDRESAGVILRDANKLEEAGAVLLVLECVPHQLATEITHQLSIPVIGIGAGKQCDGQVLVLYDILGITQRHLTFSRDYLAATGTVQSAIEKYVAEVRAGLFPAQEHQFD